MAHRHLPIFLSQEVAAKNGVTVDERQAKLLQKIKELTLHIIDIGITVGRVCHLQRRLEVDFRIL